MPTEITVALEKIKTSKTTKSNKLIRQSRISLICIAVALTPT